MNAKDFITRQLGTAGWAPINHEMAEIICPGMTSQHYTFASWQSTPAILPRIFPHTALYRVKVAGIGTVLVLARNGRFLDERMTWLGFFASEVAEVAEFGMSAPHVDQALKAPPPKFAEERQARLKALARQELPAHGCTLRSEILAARAELADKGEPAPVAMETIMVSKPEGAEEVSAIDRASSIIADKLRHGSCDSAEILAAAEGDSISMRTLQRAAEQMGVIRSKSGFNDGWTWSLSADDRS